MNPEKMLERAAAAREEATRAEEVALRARERMLDYMRRAHDAGAGYDQIARAVGISKQRVGQLLKVDAVPT